MLDLKLSSTSKLGGPEDYSGAKHIFPVIQELKQISDNLNKIGEVCILTAILGEGHSSLQTFVPHVSPWICWYLQRNGVVGRFSHVHNVTARSESHTNVIFLS